MPHDPVVIGYRIDVSLRCDRAQSVVGFQIIYDGRIFCLSDSAVFPGDDPAEFSHGRRHDVSKLFGCLCQTFIRLILCISCIQDVNGRDSRPVVRIGCQSFQSRGHDIPVPGIIRPKQFKGLVVDPDHDYFRGRDAGALIQPVLQLQVKTLQNRQFEQQRNTECRGKRKQDAFIFLHNIMRWGGPLFVIIP